MLPHRPTSGATLPASNVVSRYLSRDGETGGLCRHRVLLGRRAREDLCAGSWMVLGQNSQNHANLAPVRSVDRARLPGRLYVSTILSRQRDNPSIRDHYVRVHWIFDDEFRRGKSRFVQQILPEVIWVRDCREFTDEYRILQMISLKATCRHFVAQAAVQSSAPCGLP